MKGKARGGQNFAGEEAAQSRRGPVDYSGTDRCGAAFPGAEYAELEDAAYALRLYRDLLCLYGKKVKVEYAGGRAAAASQYQQPPPEHRPARAQTTPPSYPAPYR